jgi:hypothetical protein
MNHTFYDADRTTHIKIVVVALFAAIVVAGVSVSARVNAGDGVTQTARASGPAVKAGKPVVWTANTQIVR